MKFNRTTKQAVTNDIYKLCDGEHTKQILGQYSPTSHWNPADVLKAVGEVCLQRTSLEDWCDTPENPSADTILKRISELDLSQIDQLVNGWIADQSIRLKFHGNTKLTISIDFHQQPYYGDTSPDWVLGMARKKGTNYCICFVLVSITTNNIRCPIYVKLVTKSGYSDKEALLVDIWHKLPLNLNISRVFLDRWFSANLVVKFLTEMNLDYIMAVRRVINVKRSLAEIQACLKQHADLAQIEFDDKQALGQWARKRGLDTFIIRNFTLIKGGTPTRLVAAFVRVRTHNKDPTKRWTYTLYLYITNCRVSPRYVVRLYSKRWIVETDIPCIGTFKAFINSTRPQFRFLLFGFAVLFDTLWIVYSTFLNRYSISNPERDEIITGFYIKQSDKLQFIARRFLRFLRDEICPLVIFRGGDA